jgi:hypothetical protein
LGAFSVTFSSTKDAGSSIAERKAGTPATARVMLRLICSGESTTGSLFANDEQHINSAIAIVAINFFMVSLLIRELSPPR